MSASRTSWRPQQNARKSSRRLLIAAGSVPVIAILALVVSLFIPSAAAPIQLVILQSPSPDTQSLFPSETATNLSEKSVAEIFNPQHQPELRQPIRCSSESELRRELQSLADPAKSNSQLLIYASIRPRTRIDDSNQTVLDLHFGDAATIPAKDLFSAVANACNARSDDTRSAVILLDLLDLHVGLEGGISARDAISLIKSAVEPHKQQLAVICSCSDGQRSWELPLPEAPATPAQTAATSALPNTGFNASETAFCAAVASTLLGGHTATASDFHNKLTSTLTTSVAQSWAERQVPSPILGKQDAPLFGHLRLRSKLNLPPTTADPAANTAAAPAAPTPESTSTATPAAIATLWDSLENIESIAQTLFPTEILKIRADLQRLSFIANPGNTANITSELKRIELKISQLKKEIDSSLKPSQTTIDAAAFAALPANPSTTPQILDDCRRFIDALARPETPANPTPQPPQLQQLTNTLWADIANRLDTQAVERLQRFFSRFPPSEWTAGTIPWQLTLLHNTTKSAASASPETQIELLKSATQIRALRENTLLLLAGIAPNPNRSSTTTPDQLGTRIPQQIRNGLLNHQNTSLNQILNQLANAESWLAAGHLGTYRTQQLLAAAQSNYTTITQQLTQLNSSQKLRWFQKSTLPALVQAAALRLERRPLDSADVELLARISDPQNNSSTSDPSIDALLLLTSPSLQPDAPDNNTARTDFALRTLTQFLTASATNSPALTAADLRELIAIPPTSAIPLEQRPTWSKLRDEILRNSPSVATANDRSKSTYTGLWIAFWSLRLLETVSQQPSQPTREAFQNLLSEITRRLNSNQGSTTPDNQQDSPEILRAKLFHTLAKEWQKFASQPDPAAAVFPTDQQLQSDFHNIITTHFPTCSSTTEWATPTPPTFIGTVPTQPLPVAFAPISSSQVFIAPDQTATFELNIPADVSESTRFLINCDDWKLLSPQPLNIEANQDGWFEIPPRTSWPDQNKLTLQLQPLRPLPTSWQSSACVVAAVIDDRVLNLRTLQIQPRPETQWQLATAPNLPQLLLESTDNPYTPTWRLYLPPTTPADKPLTLSFNLQQSAGPAVNKIRLQLLTLSATRQPGPPLPGWEQPVAFNLTPGQPLALPLIPPTAPNPAASPPTAPTLPPTTNQSTPGTLQLTQGFALRVLPDIPTAVPDQPTVTPESLLTVAFRLSEFRQLVETQDPSFDPVTGRLSLTLRPVNPNTSGPIAAELHLSPALQHALTAKKLSTQQIPPSAFDSPDALAIRRAQPVPPIPDIAAAPGFLLELPAEPNLSGVFSISAAGYPFARAWKLSTNSVDLEPLDIPESDAESRLQLEVISSLPAPAATYPELVFGRTSDADGKPAILRVGVHLHEIKLEPAAEPRLRWNLQQLTPVKRLVRASKPEQEPLFDIWNRRVDASPAPAAAWNFACSTAILTPVQLPLTELEAGSANYQLTFTLERRNAPDITAALPFTIDSTQPREALIALPAIVDRTADPAPTCTLNGIADDHSRILKVEAGLDPQKLQIFWPQPNSRLDETAPAKIELSSLLRPENLPPAAPGLELPTTLHVRLTDAAGNVRLLEKSFRITSGMQNTPVGEAPPASITVEVAPNIKGKFIVSLVQLGAKQEATSARPARFENLKAGEYNVQWYPADQKLSGNYIGNKTVKLAPTPQPPPPTPNTPPPPQPAVPPGTIPPQKLVIGQ